MTHPIAATQHTGSFDHVQIGAGAMIEPNVSVGFRDSADWPEAWK